MENSAEDSKYLELLKHYKSLEARISRLEAALDASQIKREETARNEENPFAIPTISSDALELNIGQFWFAKAGIFVLVIGFIFLLTFPYRNLPSAIPSLIGYFLVVTIFLFSHSLRKSFTLISHYFMGSGLVLLYFATLRLYFFSSRPAIGSRSVELILLISVVLINLYISVRRKSVYLTGMSLGAGYITAIVSGQAYFIFFSLVVLSALTVYFRLKYNWQYLLNFGITATYLTHFIWFINNPFLGNKIHLLSSPQLNLLFLLLYFAIFAFGNLLRNIKTAENSGVVTSTFLNCFAGYGLFLLISVTRFQEHLALYNFAASLLFLSVSIFFWLREKSRYSTFFYAILGYTALSVAIIARFHEPESLIWLCWQSLIVISTAIWFRSKFIIVANFAIYLLIFFAYLIFAGKVGAVSLSFGIVALLSARIMNWQKHRLELQTEMMRNAYLIAAFFVFPYSFYHFVPESYISLSWMGVAVFYYIVSLILNNKKYRWMALLTLLLTVFYVFVIGIAKLEPVYRIVSFIVLGIMLLGISLIYTRKRAKVVSRETKGNLPED